MTEVQMLRPQTDLMYARLSEVADERARQQYKWGEQNHPNGTGAKSDSWAANNARIETDTAFADGAGTWRHILNEEVAEAFAESDVCKLRTELIQVAAVACAWVEAIDRSVA